ncbi:MAG: aminotransferase class V-fold PLP-dependent enzyme [Candidatus Brockarchaeota archaeon]|nr:aminotransferase class V-fold PLP-dependent enzyme [Candidatus Brockarchaeota archaeon]
MAVKSVKAALLNHVSGATGTMLQVDKVMPSLKEKGVMTILDATYSAQRIRLIPPKMSVDCAFFRSGNMFNMEGLNILYVSEERCSRVEKSTGFFVVKQDEKGELRRCRCFGSSIRVS